MNRNFNKELDQLLTNLTTGPLLFENAYECNAAGQFGAPVNITVTTKGVNTACISQLRVLTWDMFCHPSESSNCEFLEQPKQDSFGKTDRHNAAVGFYTSVPYGYLGPGIAQDNYRLRRTW